MLIQYILLPLFVQVALTFGLLLWMGFARRGALVGGETKVAAIALGDPNWPPRVRQISNCFNNQFQVPVLFYVLTILAIITKQFSASCLRAFRAPNHRRKLRWLIHYVSFQRRLNLGRAVNR